MQSSFLDEKAIIKKSLKNSSVKIYLNPFSKWQDTYKWFLYVKMIFLKILNGIGIKKFQKS